MSEGQKEKHEYGCVTCERNKYNYFLAGMAGMLFVLLCVKSIFLYATQVLS